MPQLLDRQSRLKLPEESLPRIYLTFVSAISDSTLIDFLRLNSIISQSSPVSLLLGEIYVIGLFADLTLFVKDTMIQWGQTLFLLLIFF